MSKKLMIVDFHHLITNQALDTILTDQSIRMYVNIIVIQ